MKTYKATVSREGKWWMVAIPELDGLTQARRLSEAPTMAREYIAAATDQELEDIDVELAVDSIGEVTDIAEILASVKEARAAADALDKYASALTAVLARSLADDDVTMRDLGTILGVSHQRAAQIVSSAPDNITIVECKDFLHKSSEQIHADLAVFVDDVSGSFLRWNGERMDPIEARKADGVAPSRH